MKLPAFSGALLVGLAVVAIALVGVMFLNRGSHVRLAGAVLKVRLAPTDTESAIAILDMRLRNPASVPFMVRQVTVHLVEGRGTGRDGDPVAQMDLDRVLEYYKLVGPRYTPMLLPRQRVQPGETLERTVAGSFAVSEAALERRKMLVVRIEDVDGNVTEIEETRQPAP
jgi:hypothetical protein